MDIKTLINEQLTNMMGSLQGNKAARRDPQKNSFKRLRAKQRHLETLRSIQAEREKQQSPQVE
jgi:ribosomal protein L19E